MQKAGYISNEKLNELFHALAYRSGLLLIFFLCTFLFSSINLEFSSKKDLKDVANKKKKASTGLLSKYFNEEYKY